MLTEIVQARELAEMARTSQESAGADQLVRTAMTDYRARAEKYPNENPNTT